MNPKRTVALLAVVSLVGCTSMRPMTSEPRHLSEHLEAGDHLVVYERSGRIVDMKLTRVDGDVLRGSLTESALTPIDVDVADIEKIDVERVDGGRTVLAVLGGAAAMVIIVPVFALAALAPGSS